jgi:carotenoid 1,2-hydratase
VAALPGTLWRIDRQTRADEGSTPKILKTLEDAPFYARSMVSSDVNGHAATAIHESLSLDRFASPWVRMLLPFRMPRI